MFNLNTHDMNWIFKPRTFEITEDKVIIKTEGNTDFWQNTYYNFQHDNAPALLQSTSEKFFSFTVKTTFHSKAQYDQCGVIIYQDSDNWFKASIEYEDEHYQRLGSVVTNLGYSDWATTDIDANVKSMYYRLSRRGSDFCIENSYDGVTFYQMRIFHLFKGDEQINFGIYACSPSEASFEAIFTEMKVTECMWH
jgi:regulation of enolase protein 1 (concanavalin A-like superfamily)